MRATKILAIALAASLAASGCATRHVYVCPTLPEPKFPTVPEIEPGELQCISDDTAESLNERELLILEWGEEQETIIKTHNRNCQQYRGRDGAE